MFGPGLDRTIRIRVRTWARIWTRIRVQVGRVWFRFLVWKKRRLKDWGSRTSSVAGRGKNRRRGAYRYR